MKEGSKPEYPEKTPGDELHCSDPSGASGRRSASWFSALPDQQLQAGGFGKEQRGIGDQKA